jgi:hypothetical protein
LDHSPADFSTPAAKDGIQKQNKIKGKNHEAGHKESEQGHEITKHTNRQNTTPLKAPIHTI